MIVYGPESHKRITQFLKDMYPRLFRTLTDNEISALESLDGRANAFIAKNDSAHLRLSEQFKLHTITRKYQALVWGIPNNQLIEGYIERHKINRKKMNLNKKGKGKYSKTEIILKKIIKLLV